MMSMLSGGFGKGRMGLVVKAERGGFSDAEIGEILLPSRRTQRICLEKRGIRVVLEVGWRAGLGQPLTGFKKGPRCLCYHVISFFHHLVGSPGLSELFWTKLAPCLLL